MPGRARRDAAQPAGDRRHPRRAPEVPGRHRPAAGLGGQTHPRRGAGGARRRYDARAAPSADLAAPRETASSSRTSPISPGRCARPGFRSAPGRVVDAIRAVEAVGFTDKRDFYFTLQACFVSRPEHRAVFAQVFRLYWRDPQFMEHMMGLLLPLVRGANERPQPSAGRAPRGRGAARRRRDPAAPAPEEGEEVELDATLTFSAEEKLKRMDFEQMSAAEQAEARRAIARLELPVKPIASRRTRADPRGRRGRLARHHARGDARRRRRAAAGAARAADALAEPGRALRHLRVDVVLLAGCCCISCTRRPTPRAPAGRRCTPSPSARASPTSPATCATRDVDAALAAAGREAQDWEGGTRIGACLHAFNRDWSRRVLGRARWCS